MTIAPQHPPVHAYDGADPYEIIPSKWGNLPRWHVNANLTGEMKDYERVRNDAIEAEAKLADIAAREKATLSDHLALQAERAAFDVEKRPSQIKPLTSPAVFLLSGIASRSCVQTKLKNRSLHLPALSEARNLSHRWN